MFKSKPTAVPVVLLLCAVNGWSQGTAVSEQKLKDAATKGFKLDAGMSVPASVRVEPVLLPAKICQHLFGKEIAENYAAVELVVSNKNQDAAFIVHSIYLDYTDWLLGKDPKDAKSVEFQASTLDNQVASVEYRIARGEAQDAQQWSGRNWTMRTLTILGVIATGSEFAFKEPGIAKAIGAFTGQVVPAAGAFWPDGAQAQMDRISDFGFRANKVVAKASSEIMVAFFPIDRFVTPGLKKIYLQSPALFFLPALALLDPKTPPAFTEMLTRLNGGTPITISQLEKADGTPTATMLLLNKLSMNRIHVSVGGVMAMDVDKVPARVDSVTFDGTPDWTKAGTLNGVINGALLSNGQPVVGDGKTYTLTPVADGSTDTELHFTLQLNDGLEPCTTLDFHVTKTSDGKTVDSNRVRFPVPGTCSEFTHKLVSPAASPTIASVEPATAKPGDTVVIHGTQFADHADQHMQVLIGGQTGMDVLVKSAREASFKVPQMAAGNYDIKVRTAWESSPAKITITASPNDNTAAVARPRIQFSRNGRAYPGAISTVLEVYGTHLDLITEVRVPDGSVLHVRGYLPSPDGEFMEIDVDVTKDAKAGKYDVGLYMGEALIQNLQVSVSQ